MSEELYRFSESKQTTARESSYQERMARYFERSRGNLTEKLANFQKYVSRQRLTRFLSRYELFKRVLTVHGSIIECGVLYGGGLMTWAQLSAILEPVNHQRRIIGFDTFSGFTSISEEDATGQSDFMKAGGLAVDSYEDLLECIELFDMNRALSHIPKVSLVRGDIVSTAPRFLEEHPHTVVSLMYLDVDVFEPTRAALEVFLPRMPKGAVLAFDEVNSPMWPGETLALLSSVGLRNLRLERCPFDTVLSYAVLE